MELVEVGRQVIKRFALVTSENDVSMKVIKKSNDEIVIETVSIEAVPLKN